MSDDGQPLLTNVTIQTYGSEADRALHDERWSRVEAGYMSRLKDQGLVSFKSMKVWNKDSDLVRVHIFEYQSPEALKACMPIWKEIGEDLFPGIAVKTIFYRGVVTDLWRAVYASVVARVLGTDHRKIVRDAFFDADLLDMTERIFD